MIAACAPPSMSERTHTDASMSISRPSDETTIVSSRITSVEVVPAESEVSSSRPIFPRGSALIHDDDPVSPEPTSAGSVRSAGMLPPHNAHTSGPSHVDTSHFHNPAIHDASCRKNVTEYGSCEKFGCMPRIQQSRTIGSPLGIRVMPSVSRISGSRLTVTRSQSSRVRTSVHVSNVSPGSLLGVNVTDANVVIGVLNRVTIQSAYCCACDRV